MMEILHSKNLATKFQILVEIAANQPEVQQRSIAKRLGISPQAVSEYIRELLNDGWLASAGRSRYSVTREGVDWIVKELREWQGYSDSVRKAISSISICAAVADCPLSKGQKVGLAMKSGLLYATADASTEATGIAASVAKAGEDIGITNIEGIVSLELGKVTVLRLPGIQRGGSRQADLDKLKKVAGKQGLVGAVGVEALTALRKVGIEPAYLYGVREAVVEAARSGLSPVVVCVDNDTSDLIRMLEDKNIDYEIIDGRKANR
jgi:putative transcriptional regulator